MKHFFVGFLLLALQLSVSAEVRLPKLISDGIVLQRDIPINIWGWADPQEKVSVTFLDKIYNTNADKQGNWQIKLDPAMAGGPYEMKINNKVLRDVLVGEVWLCSGQSNMDTPMEKLAEYFAEEASADYPMIHYFNVPQTYNIDGPQEDFTGGSWFAATNDNIAKCSATAYYFGKYLYEHLGVPIGLLNSSVGGSAIETWMSPDNVKEFPDLNNQLQGFLNKALQDSLRQELTKRTANMMPQTKSIDAGAGKWMKTDFDDSDWDTIYLPGIFAEKGITFNNGVIWLRRTIDIPASEAGKPGYIRLGTLNDSDSTWINDQLVGETYYSYPPRYYNFPAGTLKPGRNIITVRMGSAATGGWDIDRPYRLVVGDYSVDITGEWLYKVGQDNPNAASGPAWRFMFMPGLAGSNSLTGHYNSMIAPALRYNIKGVLWYQGEANSSAWQKYGNYFETMVNDYRSKFQQPDMPYIYVQLPNYQEGAYYQENSTWANMREVQRQSLRIPHTGMVVSMGLGEWNDIHPLNKRDLGKRIVLQAREVAYGESDLVSGGPLFESVVLSGESLLLTFKSVGSGIDPNQLIRSFYIAGTNGKYIRAKVSVIAKDKVKIWSPELKEPVSVRYAWADNPEGANLKNMEGYPAGSFEASVIE